MVVGRGLVVRRRAIFFLQDNVCVIHWAQVFTGPYSTAQWGLG
jgi:hypothetical protein